MLAWAALIAGTLISVVVSIAIRLDIQQQAQARFAFAADQITLRIEERLYAYALMLRGSAGMFVSSEDVTRDDWNAYVNNLHLDENLVGIQGIGYSHVIPRHELPTHINAVRAEGFSDYSVNPPGDRDVYTSILYLEPFEGRNLRAFGFDMFSEPVRREAMSRARDLDQASLSGRVELVQELDTDIQAGTLLYVPIYQPGMPIDTIENRRNALTGWAYSPFRMSDLMTGLISDWTRVNMEAIGLRIYDRPQRRPETLLFSSDGLLSGSGTDRYLLTRRLDIHGRQWLLEFEQAVTAQNTNYRQAWQALAAGLLLSTLLFSLLTSMARTRNRALEIADTLTRNIRQRELDLRAAHAETGQFREALDYVNSLIFIKDTERRYRYANKATLEMFKRSADTLAGATDDQFFPETTCIQLTETDNKVLAGQKTRSEVTVYHADGSRETFLEIKTPVYDSAENKTVTGILGISTDITVLKNQEEQMAHIAHYDALTSLPNRLLLGDRLQQGLAHVNRHGGKLAVVYLDLDGFKAINDSHGHAVGDELLRIVATRLRDALRDGDTVARIGGDEFVAILLDLVDIEQVKPILSRMMQAASDTVYIHGLSLNVSASMGVSLYPQATSESDEQPGEDKLLRQADQAMYHAKTAGKQRAHLFAGTGDFVTLVPDQRVD